MNEDDTFRKLLQTPPAEMIGVFIEWNEDFGDSRSFEKVLKENKWTIEDWNHLAKKTKLMKYDPENPKSSPSYGFRHWETGENE